MQAPNNIINNTIQPKYGILTYIWLKVSQIYLTKMKGYYNEIKLIDLTERYYHEDQRQNTGAFDQEFQQTKEQNYVTKLSKLTHSTGRIR